MGEWGIDSSLFFSSIFFERRVACYLAANLTAPGRCRRPRGGWVVWGGGVGAGWPGWGWGCLGRVCLLSLSGSNV